MGLHLKKQENCFDHARLCFKCTTHLTKHNMPQSYSSTIYVKNFNYEQVYVQGHMIHMRCKLLLVQLSTFTRIVHCYTSN